MQMKSKNLNWQEYRKFCLYSQFTEKNSEAIMRHKFGG